MLETGLRVVFNKSHSHFENIECNHAHGFELCDKRQQLITQIARLTNIICTLHLSTNLQLVSHLSVQSASE